LLNLSYSILVFLKSLPQVITILFEVSHTLFISILELLKFILNLINFLKKFLILSILFGLSIFHTTQYLHTIVLRLFFLHLLHLNQYIFLESFNLFISHLKFSIHHFFLSKSTQILFCIVLLNLNFTVFLFES